MFGLWRAFSSVVFYLTLAFGCGGLVGNGLVLWHLGLHVRKGPLAVYALHLAAADFLFLGCQVASCVAQAALGSQSALSFVVSFLGFAAGLWLLAAFSLELCLSEVFATCYQSCRPRHTSGLVCGLVWALTPPAVLLTARACGSLGGGARPGACLRYHAASVAWLLGLACVACVAGLSLFLWVACCSPRPSPRLYRPALGSVLLLPLCGLPYVAYWSLRPLLAFLLPAFPPLAALLACVPAGSRPLMYFAAGRQPGRRQPLRAALRRALGDGPRPGAGGWGAGPAHGPRVGFLGPAWPATPHLAGPCGTPPRPAHLLWDQRARDRVTAVVLTPMGSPGRSGEHEGASRMGADVKRGDPKPTGGLSPHCAR